MTPLKSNLETKESNIRRILSLGSMVSCRLANQLSGVHLNHNEFEWDSEPGFRYTDIVHTSIDDIYIDFTKELLESDTVIRYDLWSERFIKLKKFFISYSLPAPTIIVPNFTSKTNEKPDFYTSAISDLNNRYQEITNIFKSEFDSFYEMIQVKIGLNLRNVSLISASLELADRTNKSEIVEQFTCCGRYGIEHALHEGTHRLKTGHHRVILMHTTAKIEKDEVFLVAFNGNDTKRAQKPHGPFFTGRNIAAEINLPLISFSDPSLDLSREISIGWYIGNQHFRLYQFYVAKVIDALSQISRSVPILFGGSGGGYSALVQSALTNVPTRAFVWNSLTHLGRSQEIFMEPYKRFALEQSSSTLRNSPDIFVSELEAKGVIAKIVMTDIDDDSQILYLQNRSDLRYHTNGLYHFISASEDKSYDESMRGVTNDVSNVQTWTGDWGVGHVAPSRDVILACLGAISRGASPLECLEEVIDPAQISISSMDTSILLDATTMKIDCNIYNGRLSAEIFLNDSRGKRFVDIEYAFYLICDSKVISSRMYTPESSISFDIEDNKTYTIRGFAKDYSGKVINKFTGI